MTAIIVGAPDRRQTKLRVALGSGEPPGRRQESCASEHLIAQRGYRLRAGDLVAKVRNARVNVSAQTLICGGDRPRPASVAGARAAQPRRPRAHPPGTDLALFAGVLLGTHFSPFYGYALGHPVVHDFVEHPLYLGAALLYYYPLLDGNPGPRRLAPGMRVLSLALMMAPETLTGFFIYASNSLLYPFYATVHRPFAFGPLADQRIGGILMWADGMLIDTAWLVLAVAVWLREDHARTRRAEARQARDRVPC